VAGACASPRGPAAVGSYKTPSADLAVVMAVGTGDHRYEWIEAWATIPDTESGRENGRTHGVATTREGHVVVFNQAAPAVLRFDRDGTLVDSWGSFHGAHGLTLVETGGEEFLWLTDQDSGAVVKTTLDGERVLALDPPDHDAYRDGEYVPTWVAVDRPRRGGEGTVWVADGYGRSLVHRYGADGAYRGTIDGTGGAGRFDCPHGIRVDYRGDGPSLYVADRGNERVQVYDVDADGDTGATFERSFGADALTSPCAFAVHDGDLAVPELRARVTVLDGDDTPVAHLGSNEAVVDREDWPNVPETGLEAGAFNSPHDAAFDDAGNLYVVEWIVGGRITKLERV